MENLEKMSLVEQLNEIKNALRDELVALGYAKNTIDLYMREINHFINFCVKYDGEITYREIIRPIITEAIQYREKCSPKDKISSSTKDIFVTAIRKLFEYIQENVDPKRDYLKMFEKIKIRKERKEKDYLNDEEITRLLDVLEREKRITSYTRFRNILLTKLLLFGGLRISEALSLRFSDFMDSNDSNVYRVRVLGKGNKEASVYIRKSLIEDELNELFSKRNYQDGYIFITKKGRKMTTRESKSAVERFYKLARIRKTGLHLLRHTLAMKLVREGVDIIHIQKILRHSNITTTTAYARSTEEDMVALAGKISSFQ